MFNSSVRRFIRPQVWDGRCLLSVRTFSDDTLSVKNQKFPTLEDAIRFCEKLGVGYDISYPKKRYHAKKDYGDNFKWKGEPQEEFDIA